MFYSHPMFSFLVQNPLAVAEITTKASARSATASLQGELERRHVAHAHLPFLFWSQCPRRLSIPSYLPLHHLLPTISLSHHTDAPLLSVRSSHPHTSLHSLS